MKNLTHLLLTLVCLFTALPLMAQTERQEAIDHYVNTYNAGASLSNPAKVMRRSVTIRKDKGQDLVAVLNGDYNNRLNLQREEAGLLDDLLPLTIEDATVIMTSKTSLILDNRGDVHYAFSIEARPEFPRSYGEKSRVFRGFGVGYSFRNRID